MKPADSLIPRREFLRSIGVQSPNTGNKMVERGDLPPPIKRGRFKYYLESDRQTYVEKLAATREAA